LGPGVESYRHPLGIYPAHLDELPYWTYAVDVEVTARAAGLFAQAAFLVQPHDATRATDLQQRAIDAFAFAQTNGADPAWMLHPAGELYRLTGNTAYQTAFLDAWNTLDTTGNGAFDRMVFDKGSFSNFVDNPRAFPDFVQAYLDAETGSALRTTAIEQLDTQVAEVINETQSAHAHRNSRPEGSAPNWGYGTTMGRHLDPLIQRLQLGGLTAAQEQELINAISLSADYILGGNPLGMSRTAANR